MLPESVPPREVRAGAGPNVPRNVPKHHQCMRYAPDITRDPYPIAPVLQSGATRLAARSVAATGHTQRLRQLVDSRHKRRGDLGMIAGKALDLLAHQVERGDRLGW